MRRTPGVQLIKASLRESMLRTHYARRWLGELKPSERHLGERGLERKMPHFVSNKYCLAVGEGLDECIRQA